MAASSARGSGSVQVTSAPVSADASWDRFLAAHPAGDVVQSAAWGRTKVSIGQRARLTVARRTDGSLVGGAMVVMSRLGAGMHVGYVARGPIVEVGVQDADAVFGAIVSQLMGDAHEQQCRLLVVQPSAEVPDDGCLERLGFRLGAPQVSPDATIRLDLVRSDEELLAAMSPMRRRNVRKALRSPVVVEASDDVELFHRLHRASAARQGFEPRSLEYLRSQWTVLRPAGIVSILLARVAGAPVAGLWITTFAGTATYRLPGWDASAGGTANVNEALHWAVVQRSRAAGCRTYDLGGFDRSMAERILAGGEPDDEFRRSAGYVMLGFDSAPVLLARARWIVPGRALRPFASPLLVRALQSDRGRRLANRFRNG